MVSEPVEDPEGQAILLNKGAPEEVFQCSHFELDAKLSPMDPNPMAGLKEEYTSLSGDGFRVLAVAKSERGYSLHAGCTLAATTGREKRRLRAQDLVAACVKGTSP
jgi:magnesium-transporting ATPase (P-type)